MRFRNNKDYSRYPSIIALNNYFPQPRRNQNLKTIGLMQKREILLAWLTESHPGSLENFQCLESINNQPHAILSSEKEFIYSM